MPLNSPILEHSLIQIHMHTNTYTLTSPITSYNFKFINLHKLLHFFEIHLTHEKSPYIVTESVGVESAGLKGEGSETLVLE